MAKDTDAKNGGSTAVAPTDAKKRQRKDYGHTMDEREKYALSIVQQAARACRVIGENIKSGDGCSGEVLRACTVLAGTAAGSLFAGEKQNGQ